MKVLTLTHVFPRTHEDAVAPFLWNYHEAVAHLGVEYVVLAPHQAGLSPCEKQGTWHVQRFQYAPEKWERLAYTGQMHELVLKNLWNKVLFGAYMATCFFKLCRILRKERFDLVHVHWWIPSGFIMYLASFFHRTPYVITTHGTDVFILKKFPLLTHIARPVFKKAARVQTISTYVQDLTMNMFSLPARKTLRIPMPIREEQFPLSPPRFYGGTKLLCIGRLIKRKGVHVLVESLALLPPEYELTIVGTGPEETSLSEQMKRLKVEHRIRHIRQLSPKDLSTIMGESDIFILPSLTDWKGETEGLGMVLLEAQRMGLALIASNSGGMTDIVIHEETGFLFPEGESNALAQQITRYRCQDTHRAMVEGAQKRYEHFYSRTAIAEQTYAMYQDICSHGE
ncbi:glycosyl transferase group 1 [Chitinivibrio alkaliphilus ACht1]|uniref:Glycosyl transferase group 1 n=1 Tax=Chitinivibrio alkaliphilus ACht1 TaxID=1313304 RepID=U7D9M5_9BACT|nr:glycosyl transferase group 1 [Chitinivibrio alkaliphilus ACht1]